MLRKMKIDPLWAAVLLAAVVVLPALPAQMVRGQCVGGSCMSPQYRQPAATIAPHAKNQPTPAWRYEHPTGHRQAVVRIHCIDRQVGGRTERSIGSGVLVRVGGRLVVLTARHVVKDAKQIIVELFTKKTHRAVVLHVDATWDCAVLEMEGRPEGVEPAEIEWGEAATGYQNGERLESAGYGPDGKLAVNVGVFRGYRRSTAAGDGHDDWMEISGHARQGDSGGPVFNARGRVVGVLWGTDGETVMCVQPGRLHVVIESAMKYYRQNSTGGEPLVPVVFPQQRNPTPPMPGPVVQAQSSGPNGCGPGGCGPSPYNAMSTPNARTRL